jgi:hypothetical protein
LSKNKESNSEPLRESIPFIKSLISIDLREVGKKISAANMATLTQIVELCKQLIGIKPDPVGDPAVDETQAAESTRLKEAYYAGTMEAIQKDIRTALENKNVQGFCNCSMAPERADRNWSTLSLDGTGLDGTCMVSCYTCNKMWIANYGRDDQNAIVFSNVKAAAQVVVAMESNREGAGENEDISIEESAVALAESAGMDDDGIINDACLIQPGWGTTGYYGSDVLTRDAALFAGAQMFVDHPTTVEEAQIPERTLTKLAAVVAGTPTFKESGWKGPGLYAPVKVFSDHRTALKEKAPYIGLSVYGSGKAKIGEVAGRKGKIIEAFTKVRSVDFVTVAGAGGALMPILESVRETHESTNGQAGQVDPGSKFQNVNLKTLTLDQLKEARPEWFNGEVAIEIKESNVKELNSTLENNQNPEVQQLRETVTKQNTTILKLQEKEMIREASNIVTGLVAGAKVPDITKARLNKTCVITPLTESGELDVTKLTESVNTAIAEAEKEYAAIVGSGKITGMGGAGDNQPETIKESVKKDMSNLFGHQEEEKPEVK